MTKLGIMIEGQEGLSWGRWRAICTDVERLGFASLRRSEHLISLMGSETSDRDCIDCWTSLTLAAEWTKTIQFGPMVSPLTFHMPAVLARQATAVDLLSGGRLIFGIGAGWNENEHQVFDVPFLTTKGRMDRLEEGVRIIKKTWEVSNPKPPRGGTIPILMGGVGEKRHLPLVAREAAEWNYTRLDPDEYRHKRQVIAESCRESGRDPSTSRSSVMANYIVGRDRDELRQRAVQMAEVLPRLKRDSPDEILDVARKSAFVGTPAEVVEQIRSFAAVDVDLFMLQHFLLDDRDALELLASDVMPALAA
ncbi:MAG: LLM class flavin-dependent oxidoreductase [Chloroflexi bacterium]|nr:MAG: LLM class flavin-dependent oxidoreductase [Chloroflexota bacterium]